MWSHMEPTWDCLDPWNLVGRKIICAATEDDVGFNSIGVSLSRVSILYLWMILIYQTFYWVLEHEALYDQISSDFNKIKEIKFLYI